MDWHLSYQDFVKAYSGAVRHRRAPWIAVCSALAFLTLSGATTTRAAYPGQNGRIAFSSLAGGAGDLYAASPDGTGAWQQLTSDPADDAQSAWSPDGNRIAFRSRRDGNYEIYLMNAGRQWADTAHDDDRARFQHAAELVTGWTGASPAEQQKRQPGGVADGRGRLEPQTTHQQPGG
jgi:hypothetical protein